MDGVHYYPPGPVAGAYLNSDAFVCGIRGPFGSGKSTASIAKLTKNAQRQKPGPDGVRRRRTAIIRNTYPELKTTTIKSWHQWIPSHVGRWVEAGPPTHTISEPTLEWEVIFLALDRPDDVAKLLSMELSDAWINEAREVPKVVLDGLTGRVGRFPRAVDGGCTDPQIIMDTNPPDTDHWWYRMAEDKDPDLMREVEELETELRRIGTLRANQPLYAWFGQPGGLDAKAENLQWLEQNEDSLKQPLERRREIGRSYYLKLKAGKTADWIKVYVDGDYGYVQDGKPVYPEYRDSVHCKSFEANARLPLHIGMDFGLTPAALFSQMMPNGQWRHRSEVVTTDMGIVRFAEEVKKHLAANYPSFKLGSITGDPAGSIRGADERTCFDILKANGIEARPAKTNDPVMRRESFSAPMRRMIDGEPGMLIHPDCRFARKGLAGGYAYKRIQVSGDARFHDVPDKNIYSHICEAGQYSALGAGEGRELIRVEPPANAPAYAIDDYAIFG